MTQTTSNPATEPAAKEPDLKSRIISILADNLIILGLLIIFLSQGILSINTSVVNTQRLYSDDLALKKMFTILGIILVFAGLINRFDGFKKIKFAGIIYAAAGLIIVLVTYFTTERQSQPVFARYGCNRDLQRTYMWFSLNNNELRDFDRKNTRLAIRIQKCLDENFRTEAQMNETNTEMQYFEIKDLSDDPVTYYEVMFPALKDTLKVGTPIIVDLYLVNKSFAEDKNKGFKDVQAEAIKVFPNRRAHVGVEDFNYTGLRALINDNLHRLTPSERDTLSKQLTRL